MSTPESAWIQTFLGRAFPPAAPRKTLFDIRDIARSLSMQCRYVGHVTRFYSVAEHCVRVSRQVEVVADAANWTPEATAVAAKWALMHDASEAYLGDVSHPLKHENFMQGYRDAEERMQQALGEWLGLPWPMPPIVGILDFEILGLEARQLKTPVHPDWDIPNAWPGYHVLGWSQPLAEANFLRRYRRLFGAEEGAR